MGYRSNPRKNADETVKKNHASSQSKTTQSKKQQYKRQTKAIQNQNIEKKMTRPVLKRISTITIQLWTFLHTRKRRKNKGFLISNTKVGKKVHQKHGSISQKLCGKKRISETRSLQTPKSKKRKPHETRTDKSKKLG